MPRRKNKLRPDRDTTTPVLYRDAEIIRADADTEASSLPIILATETPVETFDIERMEVVNEVLLMDGLELPSQVPMIDSHDRFSVRNVLGSIRELEISDDQLLGQAFFSQRDDAQETFRDMADGHLTDFSIGARILESQFIAEGETAVIRGRSFVGPVRVVTRARVFEGSVVIEGADPNATVREAVTLRAYTDPLKLKEEFLMDKLREMLIARGMDEKLTDVEALEWLDKELKDGNTNGSSEELLRELKVARAELAGTVTTSNATTTANVSYVGPALSTDVTSDPKELVALERTRISEITDICRKHNIADDRRQKFIDDGTAVNEAARAILKDVADLSTPVGPGAAVTRSAVDKFLSAAGAALNFQAMQGQALKPHEALERAKHQNDFDAITRSQENVELIENFPAEAKDLRHAGLMDLARAYCEVAGIRLHPGMPKIDVARAAWRHPGITMERASDGAAYHTTGSFGSLMLNASNKTLLAAFDEAPVSYPMWVRTGPSTPDFKQFHRIKFGEIPDPEMVPENFPFPEKAPSDDREFSQVEKYGEIFSISLEAVINDDLSAISRLPAMQGNAMRRKINRVVYSILTANGNLRDGVALFHASSHGANLDATNLAAGAPLNVGFAVMATQSGLNSQTILNIQPRFLIVPAELAATALQITNENIVAATVANTNLYGPGGPRPLVTVIEGQLDDNSTTAWYLAANSSQIDTIELVFLQGEEAPRLSQETGFDTDTVKYKIAQSFTAFAVDYRGLYQGQA